jgi:hypothetical protein
MRVNVVKIFVFQSCLLCSLVFGSFFQNLFAYELAVVSMFHNCAPYIKEWVEYHRLLGVDHFWLYDDDSTDDWELELAPFIDSGLVEVFYWHAGKPDWTIGQIKAFQDGLKRGVGIAKWVTLLDQDEFILPMKDKSITECLEKRFSHAAAIYVNWRHFGTSEITLADREPMLSRLVRCSSKSHPRNAVGKSILRPEWTKIDQLWTQHFCPLTDGFDYVNGDGEKTLTFRGSDLVSNDGKSHTDYIRINHYAHRDENYFHHIRLPRDSEPRLILEHQAAFNLQTNYDILELLKKHYPEEYERIWKPFRTDAKK